MVVMLAMGGTFHYVNMKLVQCIHQTAVRVSSVCVCVCVRVCMRACVCARVHVCVHVHAYVGVTVHV